MKHSICKEWGLNISGQVAIVFAILLFPLLLVVGLNVDTSRQVGADRHIQIALDTASLSAARGLDNAALSDQDIGAIAISTFKNNRKTGYRDLSCEDLTITIDRDANSVALGVECTLPRLFANETESIGLMSLKNDSTSIVAPPSIDIALMLDMSDSMNSDSRLANLKTAASTLVTTLITAETGGRVRVALAPYGDAVNAGVYGNRAQGRDDANDADGDGDKVCVSRRRNDDSEYTDAAPIVSHYVGDRVGNLCTEPMILPLTNDTTVLQNAITAMEANGNKTAGHLGLAWSWYLVSSNWSDVWPEESAPLIGVPNSMKVVVVMTDGLFNKNYDSNYWSSAFLSAQDAKAICTNMLADGVLVYVIGLEVPDEVDLLGIPHWYAQYGADVLLPYCAGDPSRYFEPTSSGDLEGIYESIATLLDVEAVVLTN